MTVPRLLLPRWRRRALSNLDLALSSLPDSRRQRPRPEPTGSPHRPVRVLDLTVEADVAPSVSP